MAIFEKRIPKKVLIDDTEPLECLIENWQTTNGHTEFIIRVHRGPISDQTWHIYKRYNDFVKLHSQLEPSGIDLPLPPKKLIGNMQPEFIAERQQALQKYLNLIVMNPILVSSLPARSFIDPANYCQPFSEVALQHVSLALRGEVGWEVVGPLPDIGWRLRKHYYHVRCKSLPKEEPQLWASWMDYGPDKYIDDKPLQGLFKSLTQLQHPYVHAIELAACTDVGALVVRKCAKNGSLRDLLCNAKSKQSFMKKYGNPKGHRPLDRDRIALYGRQMLEGLKFLRDKGLPYGHLHSGNVLIMTEEDTVKLVDIENGVLGVPSFYRPYFMQHRKISTLQSVDVYCFGHTIYEMTFGAPLHESVTDRLPHDNVADDLKRVLESILSSQACKNGLPTIDDLLNEPFFAGVRLTGTATNDGCCYFKLSNAVKDHLKQIHVQIEDRLREEQKVVRSQKRIARVQEMMMTSEEEKKKQQRQKIRQEKKLAKAKERQLTVEEDHLQQQQQKNERSDSVNSTSTSVSATPPSMSAPAPPPPPPPPPSNSTTIGSIKGGGSSMPRTSTNGIAVKPDERSALLGAICNFNKGTLRKTKVN